MAAAAVSFQFETPPSVIGYYPTALFGRRESLLPDGVTVPRMEAHVAHARIQASHLARYRDVCGYAPDGYLPIAYPHVLAMGLHLALMTDPRFVVRLMGLIHIASELEQWRRLPEQGDYRLSAWVEGHREGDRGQEFDLYTECSDAEGVAWRERCTLLARRAGSSAQATRAARATLRYEKPPADATIATAPVVADHRTGRRYGIVSGDLNPIHIADWGARRFGFDRAVAHGMWSMARSLAALEPALSARPVRVLVDFKMPFFLPSGAQLESWQVGERTVFVLKDGAGHRPHLAGSAEPLAPA